MREAKQEPVNLIDWEHRKTKLAKIKVGDKVWIGEGQFPCARGIQEVSRMSDTLIMVGKGKERWERFGKDNGYQQGRSMMSSYISAVATKEEIEKFDAEHRRQEEERNRASQERQRVDALRNDLNSLFTEESGTFVQNDDTDGTWMVSIGGLSEADVRTLATVLKGFNKA